MKKHLRYSLSILGSSILLAGCCTGHHAAQWEYKIAYPPPYARDHTEVPESFLNGLAKEGWILFQKDPDGLYIFKRPKH